MFQRRHDLDWPFFRHWRLPEGWLSGPQAKRALEIFRDPLAISMRKSVVARLYPVSGDTWFDIWGFGGSFKIKGLWGSGVTWFDTFQAKVAGFAGLQTLVSRKYSMKSMVPEGRKEPIGSRFPSTCKPKSLQFTVLEVHDRSCLGTI